MITIEQAKIQLTALFENGQTPSLAQLQSIASQLSHSVPGTTSTPGMPAEVFFPTGARTILSYLVKPLSDQVERAFREE